jgi:hypothetical protein
MQSDNETTLTATSQARLLLQSVLRGSIASKNVLAELREGYTLQPMVESRETHSITILHKWKRLEIVRDERKLGSPVAFTNSSRLGMERMTMIGILER